MKCAIRALFTNRLILSLLQIKHRMNNRDYEAAAAAANADVATALYNVAAAFTALAATFAQCSVCAAVFEGLSPLNCSKIPSPFVCIC
jgi:hypothetical protein